MIELDLCVKLHCIRCQGEAVHGVTRYVVPGIGLLRAYVCGRCGHVPSVETVCQCAACENKLFNHVKIVTVPIKPPKKKKKGA